jgi:hypothetical protein
MYRLQSTENKPRINFVHKKRNVDITNNNTRKMAYHHIVPKKLHHYTVHLNFRTIKYRISRKIGNIKYRYAIKEKT